MSRKTAAAVKEPAQPDLLGAAAPQTAKPKQAVAKSTPKAKAKGGEVVTLPQPTTLIDRLRQISDAKDVVIAREILAMIREEEERKSERAFNDAMLQAQSAIPPITRDAFNKHTQSKWAKLEKISRIADPVIRQNGFTLSYGMATSPLPDHYRVVCDVSHRDGHVRRYEADVGMDHKGPKGEGNKSLAQGSGSSVTYARRYLKVMIFDIVIEGEDNDGNGSRSRGGRGDRVIDGDVVVDDSVPKVTQAQLDKLIEAIEDCGVSRAKVCEVYKVAKLADLPAAMFDTAMSACAEFKRKAKG